MGSRMINVVPLPVSLSKVMVPPCFSTTTLWTIVNPCPVPLPTSLVVKNGSKTLVLISSGIPAPVSLIRISIQSPSLRVLMAISPLSSEVSAINLAIV